MTPAKALGAAMLTSSALVFAPFANAEGLDASRSLRCVFGEAAQCDRGARCGAVTVEELALPGEVRFDFGAKLLASMDGQRTSPIAAVEVQEAALVIQGQQGSRGWLAMVERATGHLAATVADLEGVVVLSGACTAEP